MATSKKKKAATAKRVARIMKGVRKTVKPYNKPPKKRRK